MFGFYKNLFLSPAVADFYSLEMFTYLMLSSDTE